MAQPDRGPCGRYALVQSGTFASIGVGIGFFQAHSAFQKLTLKEKMEGRWINLVRTSRVMLPAVATFAAVGATFSGVECATAQYLGREDSRSGIFGGLAAGAVVGLRRGSVPSAIGYGLLFAFGSVASDFFAKIVHPAFDDITVTGPMIPQPTSLPASKLVNP